MTPLIEYILQTYPNDPVVSRLAQLISAYSDWYGYLQQKIAILPSNLPFDTNTSSCLEILGEIASAAQAMQQLVHQVASSVSVEPDSSA